MKSENLKSLLRSRREAHGFVHPTDESAPLSGEVVESSTVTIPDDAVRDSDDVGKPLPVRIMRMQKHFDAASPEWFSAARLAQSGVTSLRQVDKLARCEPLTVLGALMTCAQNGLMPFAGQAYLVPFWSSANDQYECQFIAGYQGMIEVATRSNRIRNITARTVRDGDEFRLIEGTNPGIHHVPDPSKKGKITGYYCVVWFPDGGIDTEYMTQEEMTDHRDRYGTDKIKKWSEVNRLNNLNDPGPEYLHRDGRWWKIRGPWLNHPEAMSWKTVIRRKWKYLAKGSADYLPGPDMTRLQSSDETVRVNINPDVPPEVANVSIHEGSDDE